MTNETFKTQQETFWAGDFGDEYIYRNQSEELLASNIHFFSRSLRRVQSIHSCIEFGANVGMNLEAIRTLRPGIDLHGIEINNKAAELLRSVIPRNNVVNDSILNFEPNRLWDLTIIKGVLIHIHPEKLPSVYDKLIRSTSRYTLLAEYYNPKPVSIPYRGHNDRLFKRDFAGEILDRYPDFQLIDYGFVYHRDPNCPQDDITWFLMERN